MAATASLPPLMDRHRILIVGGGFGGLYAARRLSRDERVTVTLVDRRNFHLFQPLLYQVATGALSPGEIAQPLRSIFRKRPNTTVLLGEAIALDPVRREVGMSDGGPIAYDSLMLFACADADMFPPSHAVEVFALLGGGQRDAGWQGEGRPVGGHALAIIPGVTHYSICTSPVLAAAAMAFLDAPRD